MDHKKRIKKVLYLVETLEFYKESNKDIIINDAQTIFLKHSNTISKEYINEKLSHLNSEVLKLRVDNRYSFIKGVIASIVAVIIVGAWNSIPDGSINKLIDQAQATMKTDK